MNRKLLSSGFGLLRPEIGNTLADTPKGVLSVTFALTCTGNNKVTVKVTAEAGRRPTGPQELICDGSILQQSIETPKRTPVSFELAVSGTPGGSFAYAYYAEKETVG